MGANSRILVPWSDLPKDLLDKVAKCLDTEIDVLRFRAVCSSWRSSTTPFTKFPCETVRLPFPFDARKTFHPKHHGAYFSLVERTVYRVELPGSKKPNFWLVKIERLSDGKLRILNPVSHLPVKILPETQLPKVLNTLDFRVSEVCKAYALNYVNPSEPNKNYGYGYAKKVILSVGKNDEYVVVAIDNYDILWYTKLGDEKWTMVSDYNECFNFHDVVNYNGQFYGIDAWGSTWAFDSIFESSTEVANIMYRIALKRHLVELYNGELILVEEVRDNDKRRSTRIFMTDECSCGFRRTTGNKTDVYIIISDLDKEEKKWVDTKALNDWIIVVGDDCKYAVSTKEFEGCKGTRVFYPEWCISIDYEAEEEMPHDNLYHDFDALFRLHHNSSEFNSSDCCESYYDDTGFNNFIASDDVKLKFRGFHGNSVGVCDYETGKTGSALMFPEYADIFWPPPSWLNRT